MKRLIIAAAALIALAAGAQDIDNNLIRQSVKTLVAQYPDISLQDIYKSFFQNRFGPEHIIADTAAAARYLDYELSNLPADRKPIYLYEPTAPDGRFVRVDLAVVADSIVTRDVLLSAFIDSASPVTEADIRQWHTDWTEAASVIAETAPDIEGLADDRAAIDSVLAQGAYAVHHSRRFNNLYSPHYRIIRRDIFDERIKPLIDRATAK